RASRKSPLPPIRGRAPSVRFEPLARRARRVARQSTLCETFHHQAAPEGRRGRAPSSQTAGTGPKVAVDFGSGLGGKDVERSKCRPARRLPVGAFAGGGAIGAESCGAQGARAG